MQLNVHLLPRLAKPSSTSKKCVVVVDILRATTTIVHALAHGAIQVYPCLEVEEARTRAGQHDGPSLLGGERNGVRINGFDLGNSPHEYESNDVMDKTIFFTTTNGTRAMNVCREASRVLIGSFVNFSAVCHAVSPEAELEVVCAGTDDEVSREDVLFAGALVHDCRQRLGAILELNDQAEIAADAWKTAIDDMVAARPLADKLAQSRGGRNLIDIGHQDDIDLCAQIDRFEVVPELDVANWCIRCPS